MLVTGGCLLFYLGLARAITVDTSNASSIKAAALDIAPAFLYNNTNDGVGLFGPGIYWYESGIVWGSLLDYWSYTGDAQFNDRVTQALLAQMGPNEDYLTTNETIAESRDDQAIWALAALSAAERGLPQPSNGNADANADANASWEDRAVAAFNDQAEAWNNGTCHGGLRWQVYTFQAGYDFKNALTQTTFFLLAACLARFTGNQTYADWATTAYDWMESVGLIDKNYNVYDGTGVEENCSKVNKLQWSYNYAGLLYGSAVMANMTSANASSPWPSRVEGFLDSISLFFNWTSQKGVLDEVACESVNTCPSDAYVYKALTAKWLGETTQVPLRVNNITEKISGYLETSAKAAARQCAKSANDIYLCGTNWSAPTYDRNTGLGPELAAFNILVANLARNASGNSTVSSGPTMTDSGSPSGTSSATAGSVTSKPSLATSLERPMLTALVWLWLTLAIFGICL